MGKIEQNLKEMHSKKGTDKGTPGEDTVFYAVEELYLKMGGLLYHSLNIPVDPDLPGNIKNDNGQLHTVGLSSSGTECDVVYVTNHRIFLLEVKAYASNKITLTTDAITGVRVTNKSPLHQNEMHCRHFYSIFIEAIPNGREEYIVPITVFVDKCTIEDKRETEDKQINHIAVLNNIKKQILRLNTPVEEGIMLDLEGVARIVEDNASYKKCLRRI